MPVRDDGPARRAEFTMNAKREVNLIGQTGSSASPPFTIGYTVGYWLGCINRSVLIWVPGVWWHKAEEHWKSLSPRWTSKACDPLLRGARHSPPQPPTCRILLCILASSHTLDSLIFGLTPNLSYICVSATRAKPPNRNVL